MPALMFSIFAVIFYNVPLALDDYIFRWEYLRANGGRETFNLGALLEYGSVIRQNDNGRIANLMAPLSSTIPISKTIFPFITAAMLTTILLLTARMAMPGRWRSVLALSSTWIMLLVWLPWHDSIMVADYSLNYIYSSAITLAFISALLYCNREGWTPLRLLSMIPFAILAGGWHEGFSISTCSGLLALTFLRPANARQLTGKFGWQWWTLGCIYGFATLAFALSPGMLHRADRELGGIIYQSGLKTFIIYLLPSLTAAFIILQALRAKGRVLLQEMWQRPAFIIFTVTAAVAMIFSFIFIASPRVVFWPNLCCVIIWLMLLQRWYLSWTIPTQLLASQVLAAILLALCVLQGCLTATWQIKYAHESEEILTQLEQSDTGSIFHDVIPTEALPLATLYMPPRSIWITPFHLFTLRHCIDKPFCAVMPESLRDVSLSKSIPLKGSLRAARYGQELIAPYSGRYAYETFDTSVTYTDGSQAEMVICAIPFLAERGDTLLYLKMRRNVLRPSLNRPERMVSIDLAQ